MQKAKKAEINDFRTAAIKLKMKYRIKLIENKYELSLIVNKLISEKVDAIVISSSNKLYDNLDLVLEQSTNLNIPIFSVNKKGVKNGAVAAIASDYYKMVDENLIPMAVDVLKNDQNLGHMLVNT